MKISVFTDNHAGSFTMAEHGLSYLIEHDGKRILFDTGKSDLFGLLSSVSDISVKIYQITRKKIRQNEHMFILFCIFTG